MFKTMNEIIEASQNRGGHFFDRQTLQFFGSRVHNTVYGGRYFITSEQDKGVRLSDGKHVQAWDGERRYTIRVCDDEGFINTVGEFGGFTSLVAAESAIYKMLGSDVES